MSSGKYSEEAGHDHGKKSIEDKIEALELRLAAKEQKWAEQEEKLEAKLEKWADNEEMLELIQNKLELKQEQWAEQKEQLLEKIEALKEECEECGEVDYNPSTNTFTIPVGTTAAEINLLIADASPGATIILEDGTHEFTETIFIDRDDITFSGESESGTVLNFTFPAGIGGNAIEVSGGEKTKVSELDASAMAGSTQIEIADASGISAGDTLYISQPNTVEYLLENGWDNVSFEDADKRPFREVIVRVVSVDGNTITLEAELPFDFDAIETDIFLIDLLKGVVIKDFSVTSGLEGEPNPNDFVNLRPEFDKTSVILIDGTDGAELSGISIINAPSTALSFQTSLDLIAGNLFVDGAHNKGGGGNGYGIQFYETFNSEVTDVEIFNVRHAVLFSSWHAEVGNLVEILSTNRDVNFHGSPDVDNEVIVHEAILDYDPDEHTGTGNGFWDIVSGGGSSHANTDYYETNTVVFMHAEGHDGSETIYGADGGSYIDGNGSQDVLIGGSGDDTIIGGTSKDTLTGGDGADLFVFEVGDSFDTILDFSGDLEGDRIVFTGDHDLEGIEDLTISQQGSDAHIVYGSSSKIILPDFDASTLIEEFFIFDLEQASEFLV